CQLPQDGARFLQPAAQAQGAQVFVHLPPPRFSSLVVSAAAARALCTAGRRDCCGTTGSHSPPAFVHSICSCPFAFCRRPSQRQNVSKPSLSSPLRRAAIVFCPPLW